METKGFRGALSLFLLVALVSLQLTQCDPIIPKKAGKATEAEGKAYLEQLESRYSAACNKQMTLRWDYITNVTEETASASTAADTAYLEFQSSIQAEILANFSNWQEFKDPQVLREFKYLSIKGPAKMNPQDVSNMNKLQSVMETAYATTTVCDYRNSSKCDLRLDPEIEEKLRTVTDYDELAYYWTEWHNAMGKAVQPSNYTQFIKWQTDMAKANGFNDTSEMWLSGYDDESANWTAVAFKQQMLDVWEQLRPFYNKLHAYVRMKLRRLPEYEDKITKYGYLPAHILGNMWAQDWAILDNRTKPYPSAPSLDATDAMIASNYTVLKMFQESDNFFTSLGLLPMSETFWNKSLLERPADGRDVVCHASAEDFCLGKGSTDFRIKQCTKVAMDDLVTVHHEMGHIEYFMQYTNEHLIFRDGANPGFHEAIGDALALAVVTPKHLQCVLKLDLGLDVDCGNTTVYQAGSVTETDINFLYITALQKIVFFPFAISMDSWRWEVFEGKLSEEKYNDRWWELRQRNQGIAPPSPRNSTDFDPPAKYHIVANVPYIRYFQSHILQFQFYESMCRAAKEFDPDNNASKPLYQCDFAGSKEAGTKLGEMMKLGFTKGWPVALEAITGSKNLSIDPLLNYFKPLFDYIDKELADNGESPCFGDACESVAQDYLTNKFEKEASALSTKSALAEWAYSTNLTNDAAKNETERVSLEYSNYEKKEYKNYISQFDYKTFKDPSLRRQFQFLNDIGISALDESDVIEYNNVLSEMKKIYGTGRVCPYQKNDCNVTTEGLPLNPNLEDILATVKDYDEMLHVWSSWRDATGKKIRPLYYKYVDLSNKAAKANGYANAGDYWLRKYESATFRHQLEAIWNEVKPLYEELHAYVRYKLSDTFPGKVKVDEPLPAHVLGNQWAQSFENVYRIVVPFPNATSFDVTDVLKEKFTSDLAGVTGMFEVANDFFLSLGLSNMSMAYGDKAVIVKPKDREVVCHASAWDFSDGKDYRIKMCTKINQNDFITIHHELGHIQYYLNYNKLPITYRTGANPGFHEAIGDVVALSVSTPKHMSTIGYLTETESSREATLNYLTQIALEKVAFLPFGYLIDNYRWKIFDGSIPRDKLEYYWLKMSNEYQGVVPPVKRSENDFDAGSKYHVPGNTPYIRYFVSFILQFQLHKSLCIEAQQYPQGPLHNCDIYKNAAAGSKFKKLMESGFSKNWQDLLQEVTGTNKLDASAIKEYFQPLSEYLAQVRQKEGYPIGWNSTAFEAFYEA